MIHKVAQPYGLALAIISLFFSTSASAVLMGTMGPGTGSSPGFFSHPSCPFSSCSIGGSNSDTFSWGISESFGTQSYLRFSPERYTTEPMTDFSVGWLFFHNGATTEPVDTASVMFTLNTGIVTASGGNYPQLGNYQNVDIPLIFTLTNTLNTGNPDEDADKVMMSNPATFDPDKGGSCVDQTNGESKSCNTFSVKEAIDLSEDLLPETRAQILIRFGSVDVVGFGQVADPRVGFVTYSDPSLVTEPPTILLLGIGFLAAVILGARRRYRER